MPNGTMQIIQKSFSMWESFSNKSTRHKGSPKSHRERYKLVDNFIHCDRYECKNCISKLPPYRRNNTIEMNRNGYILMLIDNIHIYIYINNTQQHKYMFLYKMYLFFIFQNRHQSIYCGKCNPILTQFTTNCHSIFLLIVFCCWKQTSNCRRDHPWSGRSMHSHLLINHSNNWLSL